MELRHLRYFTAVAEALSFSRAAAQLRVTQPALSRQIRDLEEELGCRLLRRGPNARTELTAAGERLLRQAGPILAAAARLADDLRGESTRLAVGHFGGLWLDHFSPALRRFGRRHPAVKLEPVESTPRELPTALRRGDADLILAHGPAAFGREFVAQRVVTYPVHVALGASHPLAKRRRLRLQDLRDALWVTWDEKEFPGRRPWLVDACRRAGFRPQIARSTDSMASLFVQLASGELVSHVPSLAKKLPHAGVVFTPIEPASDFQSELWAVWRRNDPRSDVCADLAAALGRATQDS
jgi:DNA-binding transcriptional LysR family regulator